MNHFTSIDFISQQNISRLELFRKELPYDTAHLLFVNSVNLIRVLPVSLEYFGHSHYEVLFLNTKPLKLITSGYCELL